MPNTVTLDYFTSTKICEVNKTINFRKQGITFTGLQESGPEMSKYVEGRWSSVGNGTINKLNEFVRL